MKKNVFLMLASIALAALLAGCGSSPTAEQDGAPVDSRNGMPTVNAAGVDANGLPRVLTDPKSILSQRSVYFDLDSYGIKDDYRELVSAHAKFMVQNPQIKVLLQGNTDERGSREYNLSLGQKRADGLKRALVLLGVNESQIESVSMGKEKPKNEGHDEAAWAENRRADILYKGEF